MKTETCDLSTKHCKPCEGGIDPMSETEVASALKTLPGWELQNGQIVRTFKFKDYHETMAFVNASAWISHTENHHPDLEVGYSHCKVAYSTHAIKGLSENDFICAAKVNLLTKQT